MIDATRVVEMFIDCLYGEDEDVSGALVVEGIVSRFGFNKVALESHRAEVRTMLLDLPDSFMKSKGGGMSFLNACTTRDEELWTGFQQTVDQLICMGIGLGLAEYMLPREMWSAFPGSVPYVVVNDA